MQHTLFLHRWLKCFVFVKIAFFLWSPVGIDLYLHLDVCVFLSPSFQARIANLRALVADLEGRVVSNRAYSRETLPPMDGTTVC